MSRLQADLDRGLGATKALSERVDAADRARERAVLEIRERAEAAYAVQHTAALAALEDRLEARVEEVMARLSERESPVDEEVDGDTPVEGAERPVAEAGRAAAVDEKQTPADGDGDAAAEHARVAPTRVVPATPVAATDSANNPGGGNNGLGELGAEQPGGASNGLNGQPPQSRLHLVNGLGDKMDEVEARLRRLEIFLSSEEAVEAKCFSQCEKLEERLLIRFLDLEERIMAKLEQRVLVQEAVGRPPASEIERQVLSAPSRATDAATADPPLQLWNNLREEFSQKLEEVSQKMEHKIQQSVAGEIARRLEEVVGERRGDHDSKKITTQAMIGGAERREMEVQMREEMEVQMARMREEMREELREEMERVERAFELRLENRERAFELRLENRERAFEQRLENRETGAEAGAEAGVEAETEAGAEAGK